MNLSENAEHVESGRASEQKWTQDSNAADCGDNGSTEHVFSGGTAEAENIPRQPVSNSNRVAEIAPDLRELLEIDAAPLPVATRPISEEQKERRRANARARYAKNPEKILAQNRAWREANKEKHDAYRAAYRRKASTKARMQPYLQAWEAKHKSWRREYNRKYYIAHREKMIAYAAEYKRRKREGN